MKVDIKEFERNLSYYLNISQNEDVYITENNESIAVLVNPKEKAFQEFMKLEGCLKEGDDGRSYEDIIGDEIMKNNGY